MSEQIYSNPVSHASENFVTVAQARHGVLTKIHSVDRTINYPNVKYFNFYEYRIESLTDLYVISRKLLEQPRCCILRCRIKDLNRSKNVVRTIHDGKDGPGTLIEHRCNWFAIDIDDYGTSTGDLGSDVRLALLALPPIFNSVECFGVATASYGLKSGIRLRLFFWSQNPVSNRDISRLLAGNKVCADLAIYSNAVQPIYTARPIFDGINDPIQERIVWISGKYSSVNIRSQPVYGRGLKEEVYTKQQAMRQADKYFDHISKLPIGNRNEGLIRWCIPLGKLVGQGHFEREDIIDRAYDHCSFWVGKRDTKKDMATIIWAIDHGIAAMEGNGQ